jgi:hypothetical protein
MQWIYPSFKKEPLKGWLGVVMVITRRTIRSSL